ncbi:nitrate ABC transporter permease, partial [Klebsiella michiganensis]
MKHAYKPQPQAGADSAPGEVITLPPLQVRKTTPPLS